MSAPAIEMPERTERTTVNLAWHEAGHAVVALLVGAPLVSVTIEAEDGGGLTDVGDHLHTLDARARRCLAGIAAEIVVFGLGGGDEDIEDAARDAAPFPGYVEAYRPAHPSEDVDRMARRIANVARALAVEAAPGTVMYLADQVLAAGDMLSRNRTALDAVARALLEKKTLTGVECAAILLRRGNLTGREREAIIANHPRADIVHARRARRNGRNAMSTVAAPRDGGAPT